MTSPSSCAVNTSCTVEDKSLNAEDTSFTTEEDTSFTAEEDTSFTAEELHHLVEHLSAPDSWSPARPVTFQLLKDLIGIGERTTTNLKITLDNVLCVLKPQANVEMFPPIYNMKRKLKSKNLNLSTPVPWLEGVIPDQKVGNLCEAIGISCDVLYGISPAPPCVLTNGVLLELRSFWLREKKTWRTFCDWLRILGVRNCSLEVGSVRQRINNMHKKNMAFKRNSRQLDSDSFLKTVFTPPIPRPSRVETLVDTVGDLSEQVGDLSEQVGDLSKQVKNLKKQIKTLTTERDTSTEKCRRADELHKVVQQEVTCLKGELEKIKLAFEQERTELEQERTLFKLLDIQMEDRKQELKKCRMLLTRWGTANVKKRERRRDFRIQQQKVQIKTLKQNLNIAQQANEEKQQMYIKLCDDRRLVSNQLNYYKRRCETLQRRCETLQTDAKRCKTEKELGEIKLADKDREIAKLVDKNMSLLTDKLEVKVFNQVGQYSDAMRRTVVNLCTTGVETGDVGPVIRVVANSLFDVSVPKVPSAKTAQRFLQEANIIGNIQVAKSNCEENLTYGEQETDGGQYLTKTSHQEHEKLVPSKPKKTYSCETCGKCFNGMQRLYGHRAIHTSERPYLCDICGKSFKTKHYLDIHVQFHISFPRLSCNICGRRFRKEQRMMDHVVGMHKKQCPHCKAAVSSYQAYVKHKDSCPYRKTDPSDGGDTHGSSVREEGENEEEEEEDDINEERGERNMEVEEEGNKKEEDEEGNMKEEDSESEEVEVVL